MADEQSGNKPAVRSESGRAERMPRSTSPFEEMDRIFDSFFPESWRPFGRGRLTGGGVHPHVDVIDRDSEIVVCADLPGVEKEDLDISVAGSDVTLRGTSHKESVSEQGNYYRSEITRGEFSRTIALPVEVDPQGASAAFKNGVLELKLPKVAMSQRRTITVS